MMQYAQDCGHARAGVCRKYRGPRGQPELHGVVHQISEADMKQIQITEGGGGNQKMGYK